MFGKQDVNPNKRKYLRVDKKFKTKHKIVNIKFEKSLKVQYNILSADGGLKYNGYTKNISKGGLCLEGADLKGLLVSTIKEEMQLKLRISIPGANHESIDTVGKVIWKDIINVLCGVEFTQIFYEERIKIRHYIIDEYIKNYKA